MAWFKVDDMLHGHPKARRAGLDAMGLWVLCGAWAAAYNTEGFVPAWHVESHRHGLKHATALEKVGLWIPDTADDEQGWRFHDWEDYQPSADEIEREREQSRERQRARRARLAEARDKQRDKSVTVTRESRVTTP